MKNEKAKIHIWSFKDIITDPSLYITFVISGAIAWLGNETFFLSILSTLGSALVQMSGALLGIVVAGLAIFLAFMDKKYVALIDRVFGYDNELFPIKVVSTLSILCLAFGVTLIIIGEPPIVLMRLILMGALWSFSYLLWQMFELVKWLLGHAKTRAQQIQNEENKKNEQSP